MINLFDESKHRRGDTLTDGGQLMSIVKAMHEYLDLLESFAYCGQLWEGTDDQKELDGMAKQLDQALVNKPHAQEMLDKIDERVAQERRDSESQACQIQTDGISTMGGEG